MKSLIACLCISWSASQLAAQSAWNVAFDQFRQSQNYWENIKNHCQNSYTYILQDVNYKKNYREELSIMVENGKVAQTQYRKYNLNKEELIEQSDKLRREFVGVPVGTLDDVYNYVANDLAKRSDELKDFIILELGHSRILEEAGIYTNRDQQTDFAGYQIKHISLPCINNDALYTEWEFAELWDNAKNKPLPLPKYPIYGRFFDDGHFEFNTPTRQCYEFFQIDFLANTLSFNPDYKKIQHYECSSDHADVFSDAYLHTTRFEWKDEQLLLKGDKYTVVLTRRKS